MNHFKGWVCTINNYILISFPSTFILSLNPYMSHEISIPNYSYLTNTKDKHKSGPPKSWWCWWSICNWFLPLVTRTNGCCCNGILHESPCCPDIPLAELPRCIMALHNWFLVSRSFKHGYEVPFVDSLPSVSRFAPWSRPDLK